FRLRALREAGRAEEALALSETFGVRHPESLLRGDVHALRARLFADGRRYARAIAEVDAALADPPVRAVDELAWRKADALESLGRVKEALAAYRDARARFPTSEFGRLARKKIADIESKNAALRLPPTAANRLAEAELLKKEGRLSEALAIYARLAADPEQAPRLPSLLKEKASALRRLGRTKEAIAVDEEIARRFPDTREARNALLDIARIHWNKDRDAEALAILDRIERDYARFRGLETVWFIKGRIYKTAGDDARAAEAFALLADKGRGEEAKKGAWQLGWLRYLNGEYDAARAAFARLAEKDPGGPEAAKADYWRAVSALKMGRAAQAFVELRQVGERYRETYYGRMAQSRLASFHPTTPEPDPAAEAPDGFEPDPQSIAFLDYIEGRDLRMNRVWGDHLTRAQELLAADLREWASREIAEVDRLSKGDLRVRYHVARLYRESERMLNAVRIGGEIEWKLRRSGAREVPAEVLRLQYPLAYWETITATAKTYQVDPFLVAALIRQESVFNPRARSRADARGLMQMLPSTARRVARSVGRRNFHPSHLYDPKINISLGVPYLAGLLRDNGENPMRALAAYNAGERALAKWIARSGHLPDDEFVENISYAETNNYVKLVMRNRYNYESVYKGRVAAAADEDGTSFN
ncbi:MAG: transglycosylase SLT domain-containing protein, partial [Candidatus Methylomirabilis sp.]|nr:transglycosylase SLT domain-containing protein [Deltaproteobacteria bacterium]